MCSLFTAASLCLQELLEAILGSFPVSFLEIFDSYVRMVYMGQSILLHNSYTAAR